MSKEEWLAQKKARDDAEQAQEAAQRTAAAQRKIIPPSPPSSPVAKAIVQPARRESSSDDDDGSPANKPKKPTLPNDFALWKEADYFIARRDRNPRLPAAVSYLGQHSARDENAVELLVKLLESPADQPAVEDSESQEVRANDKLIQPIVAAIAANGSAKAKQTLAGIVDGSIKTANPEAVASVALKVLLSAPGMADEDLLIRVATAPDDPANDTSTASDRANLRKTAIATINTTASEALRLRLAEAVLAPETPQVVHDQLWACLTTPRPENLAAQVLLYQSNRLDRESIESLEQAFALQSAEAMGRLLGIRQSKRRAAMIAKGADAADPYRVAELLWSPDLFAALDQRLLTLDSLAGNARLVGLASTIPNPTVRAALLRTLVRHWDQGTKGLKLPDAAEGFAMEPGFVVLLKMLPHRDAVRGAVGAAAGNHGAESGEGGLSASKVTKPVAKLEVRRRQEQTAQQWAEFSRGVVTALCRQLHAIAKAKPADAARAERTPDDVDLAFKPHPRATIVAAYQLNWPADLNDKIETPPLLRVRYVRIEQKAQPAKVLAYYRRQMTKGDEHAIPGGLWIETLDAIKEGDTVRSIDVFLTKASVNVPGLIDEEQEITVEILTVECAAIAAKGSYTVRGAKFDLSYLGKNGS